MFKLWDNRVNPGGLSLQSNSMPCYAALQQWKHVWYLPNNKTWTFTYLPDWIMGMALHNLLLLGLNCVCKTPLTERVNSEYFLHVFEKTTVSKIKVICVFLLLSDLWFLPLVAVILGQQCCQIKKRKNLGFGLWCSILTSPVTLCPPLLCHLCFPSHLFWTGALMFMSQSWAAFLSCFFLLQKQSGL